MRGLDTLRQRLGLVEAQAADKALGQERLQLVRDYRETFSRPAGRRVFAHMVRELGLFERSASPEEAALRNYATDLVRRLGLDVTEDLANAILDTPYQEETTR